MKEPWTAKWGGLGFDLPGQQTGCTQTNLLSPFLKICTNKQTRKPNKPIGVGQRDTAAAVAVANPEDRDSVKGFGS